MKKICFLTAILFSALLAGLGFVGCQGTTGPSNTGITYSDDSNTALQAQIDAAPSGGSVTLNQSSAGGAILINKALTVDGNNNQGLTIKVSSAVTSNVTLRNFRDARIVVTSTGSSPSTNRFRDAAATNSSSDHFKKIGEGAVPIKLEGCTVEKIEAESKVQLKVDNGNKKSTIGEIKLKDGAEDFTFIEMDKVDKPELDSDAATPLDDKTKVSKLSIEYSDKQNETEKINLIGGTFEEVTLPESFGGEIDFKYDKELEGDQLHFSGKDSFLGKTAIKEKDVAVAEKSGNSNVYSFTMSKNNFVAMNGFLTIVFMTPAQKSWMDSHNGNLSEADSSNLSIVHSCATTQNPIYMMIPAGAFTVDNPETATGLKTIYGGEYAYVDYAHYYAKGITTGYEVDDVVVLDKYRNYNRDAIIADFNGDSVTIYVNTTAIRKEDVVLCNGECVNGQTAKTEAGTKVSEMNLDGYVPYLAVDYATGDPHGSVFNNLGILTDGDAQENFRNGTALGTKYCSMGSAIAIYGSAIKLGHEMDLTLYGMTGNASYPASAASTSYSSITTPASKDDHGLLTQFNQG